jgi:hypothetical protein
MYRFIRWIYSHCWAAFQKFGNEYIKGCGRNIFVLPTTAQSKASSSIYLCVCNCNMSIISSSYIYATIANFVWMFPISLTSISALVRFKLALCQPAKEINVCGTHYFINQCHSLMSSTSHQELLFLDLDAQFYLFIYLFMCCYWTWQLQ